MRQLAVKANADATELAKFEEMAPRIEKALAEHCSAEVLDVLDETLSLAIDGIQNGGNDLDQRAMNIKKKASRVKASPACQQVFAEFNTMGVAPSTSNK